jgi:predicted phosphodiesterase
VPGTGRERNIIYDAGDLLQVLLEARVNVALSGHKHVPYVWRLEDLLVINAGTVSSLRLRGHTKPCYNILKISGNRLEFFRKYPYGEEELVCQADFPRLAVKKPAKTLPSPKGAVLK